MGEKVLLGLISAVISGVVSLLITRVTGPSSERRLAQLQRRAGLVSLLEEITIDSVSYWRSDGRDAAKESAIKQRFERLFFQVDQFFFHAANQSDLASINGLAVELLNTVTGGSFEGANRNRDDLLAAKVKSACRGLAQVIASLEVSTRGGKEQ